MSLPAYAQVCEDYLATLDIAPELKNDLRSAMNTGATRHTNMCGGRMSDSMRSEVWAHKNSASTESYIAKIHEVGSNLRKLGY